MRGMSPDSDGVYSSNLTQDVQHYPGKKKLTLSTPQLLPPLAHNGSNTL